MLAFPSFLAPASVCASLLNSLLRREDWAKERLARHAGKSVQFVAAPWKIGLAIQADGLVEVSNQAIVPDVTLTLPSEKLSRLPAILRKGDTDEITALLHIQGDAALAQAVSELARGLRWDIEDDLARVVGDVAALRLVGAAKGVSRGVRQSASRLAENTSEYLVEESRQVLGRPAFDDWRDRLHTLHHRLEQLEGRVERIKRGPVQAGQA